MRMSPAWAASPSTTERSVEVCACSPEPQAVSSGPAALLAAGPLLTACGSGLQAQTSTERSVVDGEAAQAGDILIRYAHIDSPADPAHSQGGTALAYAAFYNGGSQPDALVSASADAATSVDVVPPSGAGVSGTGPSASPAAGTAGASTTGPAAIPAGGSL